MSEKELIKINKNDELLSLNENLCSEFFITELEERLETDPLFLSSMMDVQVMDWCAIECIDVCVCDTGCLLDFSSCTEKG